MDLNIELLAEKAIDLVGVGKVKSQSRQRNMRMYHIPISG